MNLATIYAQPPKYFTILTLLFCWISAPNTIQSADLSVDPWEIVRTNWSNQMPDFSGYQMDYAVPGCLDLLPDDYNLFLSVHVATATNDLGNAPDIYVELDLGLPNGINPDGPSTFVIGPVVAEQLILNTSHNPGVYEQTFVVIIPFSAHCPDEDTWDMNYVARLVKDQGERGFLPYNTKDHPNLFPFPIFSSYDEQRNDIAYGEDKQECCWTSLKERTTSDSDQTLNELDDLAPSDLHVFPNPIRDEFTLQLDKNVAEGEIQLLSTSGHVLKQIKIDGQSSYHLNTSDLSAGLYVCQITTSRGLISKKIMKL